MDKADSQFIKVVNGAGLRTAKEQKKFGVILACQDAQILDASTASINDVLDHIDRLFQEVCG